MKIDHLDTLPFIPSPQGRGNREIPCSKRRGVLRNEKGIALVTVLILALIALTIISSLIFLVTQGTKVSGFYKRYATALDAGYGGAEIATSLVYNRGELDISGLGVNYTSQCVCAFDNDPSDEVYSLPSPDTCLCRKLCIPPYKSDLTYNWGVAGAGVCPAAGASMDAVANPDMQFRLTGTGGTDYQVSAKIVDTTIGVTDLSGELLSCGTGTGYPCEGFQGTPTPYLYRIEVDTRGTSPNLKEKSRLSVLYAF
jgi:Flp pilus assembly pilin Flp